MMTVGSEYGTLDRRFWLFMPDRRRPVPSRTCCGRSRLSRTPRISLHRSLHDWSRELGWLASPGESCRHYCAVVEALRPERKEVGRVSPDASSRLGSDAHGMTRRGDWHPRRHDGIARPAASPATLLSVSNSRSDLLCAVSAHARGSESSFEE